MLYQYQQDQLIIIIVTTMNTVTDRLKKSLAERHEQPNYLRNDKNNSTRKDQVFQQKFMQHFETINKTPTNNKQDNSIDNQELKFKKTLIDYSSKSSPIDAILLYDGDAIHMVHSELPLVVAPIIPGLKPSSLQTIKITRDMFMGKQQKQNSSYDSNSLMIIEYYSQILKDIGRKDIKKQLKVIKNNLAKSPTYQQIDMKEIQTEQKSIDQQVQTKTFQRTNRKELILMQLIREKKRKNFAPDYFMIMEMKLMGFLEFILEDQSQYIGLDPHSKVREVLRKLQSFQGKMIEGESKINLLRIFFQEFTELKRQKDQLQAMKAYTPMKGLENRQRQKTPGSTSGKFRTTKQTFKQSKITPQKETTPLRKQTQMKVKKQQNIKWMYNQRYEKDQSRLKTKKKNEPNRDEWIGFC